MDWNQAEPESFPLRGCSGDNRYHCVVVCKEHWSVNNEQVTRVLVIVVPPDVFDVWQHTCDRTKAKVECDCAVADSFLSIGMLNHNIDTKSEVDALILLC